MKSIVRSDKLFAFSHEKGPSNMFGVGLSQRDASIQIQTSAGGPHEEWSV